MLSSAYQLASPSNYGPILLDGRQAPRLAFAPQAAGPQQLRWDGTRRAGTSLLPPGLYRLEVALLSDEVSDRLLRPLGIAY